MRTLNEDYPRYAVRPISSFQDLLTGSAAAFGAKLALEDLTGSPIGRASYVELLDLVKRFGQALRRAGLVERDHVAIVGENRVQWAIAYLAVTTANLVAVPIDKSLKENDIVTILHASDARAVIYSEALRDTVLTLGAGVRGLKTYIDMDLPARESRALSMVEMLRFEDAAGDFPALDTDAVSVIVFTSGAMGRAKGVMLSQSNITANLKDMLSMVELLPEDRFLSVLPMHHTYECTCGILCPLTAGSSVHFARSLKTVLEDMQRVRATVLLGVPLLYDKMYKRIVTVMKEKPLGGAILPTLGAAAAAGERLGLKRARQVLFKAVHEKFGGAVRILVVGGAAPSPEVARGLRTLGFAFIQGYGLTETSPIVALNRLRKFRDDAAGVPLPSVEVKIADPDGSGHGEILVKGPSVMLGYYKNEEATRQVMRDGWFVTGDIGFVDPDGFLHVSGRKKNVIVAANGKNVYPEELEDRVNAIPYVLESVVHGERGPSGDEEICVVVVPNAEELHKLAELTGVGVTRGWVEDVINREVRALNRRLPMFQQIRRVRLREGEFEKTTTQKIKRYLLHQEDTTH